MVYVDDILAVGKLQKLKALPHRLGKYFKLTHTAMNEDVDFLGCQITLDSQKFIYQLSQVFYLQKVLQSERVTMRSTPFPSNLNLTDMTKQDLCETDYPFQRILGRLGYLRYSRPDLLFALHQFSKVAGSAVTVQMKNAMQHCLGYLKKTSDYKLQFYPPTSDMSSSILLTFTDAAFASDARTRKSSSGYFIYFQGNLVSAYSATQSRVATSSAEAELTAIYSASKRVLTIRGLLGDIEEKIDQTVLLTDSSSCVQTLHNNVSTRYKFLAIYIEFVKEIMVYQELKVLHLNRRQNIADILTKQPIQAEFERLWRLCLPPLIWLHKQVESNP